MNAVKRCKICGDVATGNTLTFVDICQNVYQN